MDECILYVSLIGRHLHYLILGHSLLSLLTKLIVHMQEYIFNQYDFLREF